MIQGESKLRSYSQNCFQKGAGGFHYERRKRMKKFAIITAIAVFTLSACGNHLGDGARDAQTASDIVGASLLVGAALALVP